MNCRTQQTGTPVSDFTKKIEMRKLETILSLQIFIVSGDIHHHHPSAAEQATTRFLQALLSWAIVAIWSADISCLSYPNT